MSSKKIFPFTPNPTFWAPVEIPIPGEAEPGVIDVEFRFLDSDDTNAFLNRAKDSKDRKSQVAVLQEIIHDWKNVPAGSEFSEQNLDLLLRNYPIFGALAINAFTQARMPARTKN